MMFSGIEIRKKLIVLNFSYLFTISQLNAQILFQYDSSVRVFENGKLIENAWAGGINSGQFGKIDINGDGVDDLVVYDRSANLLHPFITMEEQYVYHPSYRAFFPDDIEGWILFRDYDCDGRKDIFAHTDRGMKVYRNNTDTGSKTETSKTSAGKSKTPVFSIGN